MIGVDIGILLLVTTHVEARFELQAVSSLASTVENT